MRGGGLGYAERTTKLENHGGGEFCVCQFGGGMEGERGERGVQHGATTRWVTWRSGRTLRRERMEGS